MQYVSVKVLREWRLLKLDVRVCIFLFTNSVHWAIIKFALVPMNLVE